MVVPSCSARTVPSEAIVAMAGLVEWNAMVAPVGLQLKKRVVALTGTVSVTGVMTTGPAAPPPTPLAPSAAHTLSLPNPHQ
jgi:hypothetical protein